MTLTELEYNHAYSNGLTYLFAAQAARLLELYYGLQYPRLLMSCGSRSYPEFLKRSRPLVLLLELALKMTMSAMTYVHLFQAVVPPAGKTLPPEYGVLVESLPLSIL